MENKSLPSLESNDTGSFATSERKRKAKTFDASDVAPVTSSLKKDSKFQRTSGGGNASENSPMSEKLWDGFLQLNSSITVSAVAFFKSGDRLLDITWSKSVEVKGKVRLDAFEKYIHDLPRSRTRGLMVISLCAKEGSSEKETRGLKEVSKAYIEGERVGIAQLSPGVVVYLCPRCDRIFRILAKYGSFVGIGATEDKLESLIGCVVWRKNQTAESSVVKEKDSKSSLPKQFQKSPSDSDSASQNAGGEEKATMWATPSVPANSAVAVEQQGSRCFNLTFQTTSKMLVKTTESLEIPSKLISGMMKPEMPADADDDLPEYDYRTSCVSSTSAGLQWGVPRAGIPVRHSGSASNQGMTLPEVAANRDPRFHVSGGLEDRYDLQTHATPAAFGALPHLPHL